MEREIRKLKPSDDGSNEKWDVIKFGIKKVAEEELGYKRIKKPRITYEMLDKMEERRKYKHINNKDGRRT
ncbi:hypothetical protein ILUMI_11850 [Ignelater luminosus]|uniref:Uncharacterized protein n=1 Tax=Ignelater luminosus TaxID=2038154 RepID=A0A8K0CV85_IGNLU|nr:hypothetical protein ILUMI_11850 [Ignelater luminosus]